MKFGSLFTGVGGFDLGFERAGMQCAWQVEFDKHCQAVLKYNWPFTTRYEDVNNVGKSNLESVSLICGGFPCQDVSIAGKRGGLAAGRSGLWFEFERIIDETRPRWAVIENVPGLFTSNEGRDFATIISSLDEFGYGVAWRSFDSQFFGVAQKRKRVFIIASLGDLSCGKVLFESEGGSRSIAESSSAGQENSPKARTSSEIRGGTREVDDSGEGRSAYNVLGKGGNAKVRHAYPTETARTIDTWTGKDNKNAGATFVVDAVPVVGALQARDYKGVGTQYVAEGKVVAVGHSGGISLKMNDKVNTISTQVGSETTAMFNGVWETHLLPRRLTPLECERLQGFPDNHTLYGVDEKGNTFEQKDGQRYKQMGNAVTVDVIEWLGRRIMEVENGS